MPSRDFNYMKDTCRDFIELATCDKMIGEVVNIEINHAVSMFDNFNLIRELLGNDAKLKSNEQHFRQKIPRLFDYVMTMEGSTE